MPPSHKSSPRDPLSWHFPVAAEDVPADGRHFDLVAPETALKEIAQLANVRALSMVAATFDLKRTAAGLRVSGRVRAAVEQTCVVTLEPLHNQVDESVDLVFSEGQGASDAEISISAEPDAAEPAELLEGGKIDLAALAVEFLLLGIDPYPRKEGSEFGTAVAGNPEIEPIPHPFAALAALKKRDDGQNH